MRAFLSAAQMKAMDERTIHDLGIPSAVLMERAALEAAGRVIAFLEKNFPEPKKALVLTLCGVGNNGGDGFAMTRILHQKGFLARAALMGSPEKFTGETKRQVSILEKIDPALILPLEKARPLFSKAAVLSDALFGIGLSREISGLYRELIAEMNASAAYKLAVDIPSGVDADSGQIHGIAFRADETVTMAAAKAGLCLSPGRDYAGRVTVAEIGVSAEEADLKRAGFGSRFLFGREELFFPAPDPGANKGSNGKLLLIAGSPGMCGAAYLAAAAALHTGCGMVKILTSRENRIPLQSLLPEALLAFYEDEAALERAYAWCDLIAAGPGLSVSEKARELLWRLFELNQAEHKPLILDADALNLLSMEKDLFARLSDCCILTPHLLELSRLSKLSLEKIRSERVSLCLDFSRETGAVLVCKDAASLTAGEGRVYINQTGNAGMATAGSGDVLTGVIAGCVLALQNGEGERDLPLAAALGVCLHGAAGDLASGEKSKRGMSASDLIPALSAVLKELEEGGRGALCLENPVLDLEMEEKE